MNLLVKIRCIQFVQWSLEIISNNSNVISNFNVFVSKLHEIKKKIDKIADEKFYGRFF